jgi:cobalamin biosynthesis protein CobD/CbiB
MDNLKKKQTKTYTFETAKVFGVAFEMGFIIALPIVLFGFAGKWLDAKYQTHFFVYIAIAVSLIFSGIWLYKRLAELARKLQEAAKREETQKPSPPQQKTDFKPDNFEKK